MPARWSRLQYSTMLEVPAAQPFLASCGYCATCNLGGDFAFVPVSHGKVALHDSGCFDAGSEIDFSNLKTIFRDLGCRAAIWVG
jgi:hypothetical protein